MADTTFSSGTTITSPWLNDINAVAYKERVSVKRYGAVGDGATTDQTAIAAAVADCLAKGYELYWPAGTYLTTASIANFHSVRHSGPGVVKRGTDLFYITPPTNASVNNLYVATTGNNSNDGLSSAQPMLTLQAGIDTLNNYGPVLRGTWKINLAAGTYARGRFPDDGLPSVEPIYIQGPNVGGHPFVPTALIKEGATQTGFGILASQNTRIYLKDLKIEDWNGNTSTVGVRVNTGSELITENVHFEDCYYGITGSGFTRLDVKGGIFNDCGYLLSDPLQGTGYAIRGMFHTRFEIGTQNAGTLAGGPIIQNSAAAIRAQELCTGHCDWVTIQDCAAGIRLLVNSRLNCDGTSFKRITSSAIYATQGCYIDTTSNTVFGTGADANVRNISMGSASNASAYAINNINLGNASGPLNFKSAYPGTVVNTIANTVIDTQTVLAGAANGTLATGIAAQKIGVRVRGTLSGTTGTFKRLVLRVGGTPTVISFSATATGAYEAVLECHFLGINSQFVTCSAINSTFSPVANANLGIATNANIDIALEALVQNVADSITISSYEWYSVGF